MDKVDPREYQKRLDRISEILSAIGAHVAGQTKSRCPYKNRHDQCTASFGCRNQRRRPTAGEPPHCAGDDKLDYRQAWETTE